MARKGFNKFHSSKLSTAENNVVNMMIKRSWSNGKKTGWRSAFRQLYQKGILKSRK